MSVVLAPAPLLAAASNGLGSDGSGRKEVEGEGGGGKEDGGEERKSSEIGNARNQEGGGGGVVERLMGWKA